VTGHNARVTQVSTDEPTERRRGRPRWATRSPGLLALYRCLIAFFGGLAILSSEFRWAKVVLTFLRRRYDAWRAWIRHRHWTIRLLVYLFGAAMVVATLWALNAFALVANWVGIDRPWLHSPFFG
jgi:hypothetical protein